MSETIDEEIGRRIRYLYRMWNKSYPPTNTDEALIIGHLRISRTADSWIVVFRHKIKDRLVYFDINGIESDGSVKRMEREARKACLVYLRQLMLLDDLANA